MLINLIGVFGGFVGFYFVGYLKDSFGIFIVGMFGFVIVLVIMILFMLLLYVFDWSE